MASSMVCLSSINTTPASLSFRVEADLDEREHAYEAVNLGELASVLDLPSARHLGSLQTGGGPALQDLGSISLREGRLVAIPNVLQRRMEPFALEDLTFTGYKRFLTLYLVDPHYRVCSTRNVPPQQHDWWWDAAGGDKVVASWAALGVPQEVADKIGQEIGEWPMGTQEARRIMGDRRTDEMLGTAAVQASVQSYFFSTSTLR